MGGLLSLLLFAAFYFEMMRFGCGAHIMREPLVVESRKQKLGGDLARSVFRSISKLQLESCAYTGSFFALLQQERLAGEWLSLLTAQIHYSLPYRWHS